tara:strand:- start:4713 stop:5249 length:537 start_codon:yes stop_codon:yes gene_type:complete
MEMILKLYLGIFMIGMYLFLNTPISKYRPKEWFYKLCIVFLGCIFIIYSIFSDNRFEYIGTIILVLNVGILIFLTKNGNKYIENGLKILLIYLILIIINIGVVIKRGKIVNVNKSLIYNYILILSIWFLFSNNTILNRKYIGLHLFLLLYPLFYNIEEYFIHRVFLIFIVGVVCFYNK